MCRRIGESKMADFISEIRATDNVCGRCVELYLLKEEVGNRLGIVTGMNLVDVPEGARMTPSTLLTYDAAKSLMDDLWKCGIRPGVKDQAETAMAATTIHLQDMRRIVFSSLKMKEPNT